jgi:hypothetical protein
MVAETAPAAVRAKRRLTGNKDFYPMTIPGEEHVGIPNFSILGKIEMIVPADGKLRFYRIFLYKHDDTALWHVRRVMGKNYPRQFVRHCHAGFRTEEAARQSIARKLRLLIDLGYLVEGHPTL